MIKNNKGFSLVEAMVVLAIAAIIGGLAIPGFIKYRNDSMVRSSAYMMTGGLKYAKSISIENCSEVFVVFTDSYIEYTWYEVNDSNAVVMRKEQKALKGVGVSSSLSIMGYQATLQDGTTKNMPVNLVFNKRGFPYKPHPVNADELISLPESNITLTGSKTITIEVTRLGKISIVS